jgi:hypothetical protein
MFLINYKKLLIKLRIRKMTNNKLPQVGKRYKTDQGIIKIKNYGFFYEHEGVNKNDIDYNFNYHFKNLEELPDQPTSAKSAQVGSEKVEEQEINFSAGGIFLADRGSHQVNFVTKEVQEAKEKLKELTQSFNRNPFTKEDGYFMKGVDSDRLLSLSWDIINALEEQKAKLKWNLKDGSKYKVKYRDYEYFTGIFNSDKLIFENDGFAISVEIIQSAEEQKAETKLDKVFATPEPEEKPKKNSVGAKEKCKECNKEFFQSHQADYYCSNYCISKMETTESIWNPISDLPDHNCQVLIKAETGNISRGEFWFFQKKFMLTDQGKREVSFPIKKYCTLTDFVNQQEAIAKNQEIIFAEIAKLKNK